MPRVVPDQREKFENDELFRKMSRESEVSGCYSYWSQLSIIDISLLPHCIRRLVLWRGRIEGIRNSLQPTLDMVIIKFSHFYCPPTRRRQKN